MFNEAAPPFVPIAVFTRESTLLYASPGVQPAVNISLAYACGLIIIAK
jgi:hypothetical protein